MKNFETKKHLGQHFLRDENIINKIVQIIDPKASEDLIEIGPGLGALTCALLPKTLKLTVIEYDKEAIPLLRNRCQNLGELKVIEQDALKVNLAELSLSKFRLVGNLPYNISTPLLFHFLEFKDQIIDMHFMLQKEVVVRIAAEPGSKLYGRLSVMLQYFCEVQALFKVSPQCFAPPPKVDSQIIRLIPYQKLPAQALDEKLFSNLVRDCFSHRRKALRNTVKKYINTDALKNVSLDLNLRPEQLSVYNFVDLSNQIFRIKEKTPS